MGILSERGSFAETKAFLQMVLQSQDVILEKNMMTTHRSYIIQ